MCHPLDPSPYAPAVVLWFLIFIKNETQVQSSEEILVFGSEGGCLTGTCVPKGVPYIVSPERAATASDSSWRPPTEHTREPGAWQAPKSPLLNGALRDLIHQ